MKAVLLFFNCILGSYIGFISSGHPNSIKIVVAYILSITLTSIYFGVKK